MYCRYCGKKVEDDSLFCSHCGKPLEGKQSEPKNTVSQPETITTPTDMISDSYYLKQASKFAGSTLKSATKTLCYIALVVFLFLNIKMAPSFGITKIIIYVITAVIAICSVVFINKKVFNGYSKAQHTFILLLAIFVILTSATLRIVYESKVDSVAFTIPTSGTMKVKMEEKTEYYDDLGIGTIRNPSTTVWISGDQYVNREFINGDVIKVKLNEPYSFKIRSSGKPSYAYGSKPDKGEIVTNISFNSTAFKTGKYIITQVVELSSTTFLIAKVQLTFKPYHTFWEVITG